MPLAKPILTMPSTERKTVTQPSDWWAAFEEAATASGMKVSEWLGEAGKKQLPKDVRKQLSDRPGAHRPISVQPRHESDTKTH